MNILLAFDKFKDSMAATRACEAAESGIHSALEGNVSVDHAPLTDGGEGFCRILTEAADGYLEYHPVTGPIGEELDAPIGWVEADCLTDEARHLLGDTAGRIAVIEMASVAGLEQVPFSHRHPRHCTTRGVGELIRVAVAEEAGAILLGIGGSATSDLGLGALESMGLRLNNTAGTYPSDWPQVEAINGELELDPPPIHIACDVSNPLLGEKGAAAIYGPQKGLKLEEVESFDAEAGRMATLLCRHFDQPENLAATPGCGAAGGIGFGLKVACGAIFVPGFELVAAWLNLSAKVARADLVFTGEGKFDRSSLSGKGPYALLLAARASKKPAILLAGTLDDEIREKLARDFPQTRAAAISPKQMPLEEALQRGPENLELQVHTALLKLTEP